MGLPESPLIGTYSGTRSPKFITANNPSGCLTINFIRDAPGLTFGWSVTSDL